MEYSTKIRVAQCTASEVVRISAREPAGKNFARQMFARQEEGRCLYLVAWDGDDPVGSGELAWDETPELRNVRVDEEHRGRGIGSIIIRAAEDEVPRPGCLRIGVGIDNPDARRLYLRLGYVPTGETERYSYEFVDDFGVRRSTVETSEHLVKGLS